MKKNLLKITGWLVKIILKFEQWLTAEKEITESEKWYQKLIADIKWLWMVITKTLPIGKQPVKIDNRTLRFEKYLKTELPVPPYTLDLTKGLKRWGMMGNDKYGDCTIASAGHLIMLWTQEIGKIIKPTARQIEKDYFNITNGEDTGCVELDVLNYWRKNGIAGHKIGAYAGIKLNNSTLIQLGLDLFNGIYIGLALPLSAQSQVGKVWDVISITGNGEPGSWGGHAVPIVAYDDKYLYCVTWGKIQKMTWRFWTAYCDEAYCIISNDYISGGKTIEGFDLAALQADLLQI
jgi:hypothetical protein